MAVILGTEKTFHQTNKIAEEVDDAITMLDPVETPLTSMIQRVPTANPKTEWIEESLRGFDSALTVALASQASAATGTATVTAGDGTNKFHTNADGARCLIMINEELLEVVANAANTLTVIRGYGGTTIATHAIGDKIRIISETHRESWTALDALAQSPGRPYNYVMPFTETVEVSGTLQAALQYGLGRYGNVDFQVNQRLLELGQKLERAVLYSTIPTAAPSATVPRTMDGIRAFIPSGNQTDAETAALTDAMIRADLGGAWDDGGRPSVIMGNRTQIAAIGLIYENRIRTTQLDNVGGMYINVIVNPISGEPLYLINNRRMAEDELFYLDMRFIQLAEYRPWHTKPLAETGDHTRVMISGEFTLKFKEPESSWRRYNLAT